MYNLKNKGMYFLTVLRPLNFFIIIYLFIASRIKVVLPHLAMIESGG